MAGLSLSIRTLRIRVSFYKIVKLHGEAPSLGPSWPEVVIPLNNHENKRAKSGRVKYDFSKIFPCCKARAQSKSEPFSHGLLRPLRFRFCSNRVCNGRKLCGSAFLGARQGPRGVPAPLPCARRVHREKGQRKELHAQYRPRHPVKNMSCSSTHGGFSSSPCARPRPEPPPLRQRLPQTGRYDKTGTDPAN